MKKSFDGGLTWTERLPVPDNWATSLEVPTLYPVVDPAGLRRLVMFSGRYPARMAVSEDNGETWSPLAPIGDFGGSVVMSDLVRLKDGTYMALFHDDGSYRTKKLGRSGVSKVYKTLSKDGGRTWGEPQVVVTHPQVYLCEPGAARSPNGGQIALLMREESRTLNSMVSFSNDEGITWTDPVELPGALTGDRHQARYAPDGRLVVTFRDTGLDTPTWGDWVAWVGTYDDVVHRREGQYRLRLMDNKKAADCAYAGLLVLPDGSFVATTYGHWIEAEEPYIASVRFDLEEMDAKAAALGCGRESSGDG